MADIENATPAADAAAGDDAAETVDGRRLRRERNIAAVIDAVLEMFKEEALTPTIERAAERSGLSLRSGVVRTVVGDGFVCPQSLVDLQRFLEPIDAHAGAVLGDARFLVVRAHPPGAQADLEPALGEHVERGELLGHDDGVPVVVAEHDGPDAQRLGGDGRGGHRRHGCQLLTEVVHHLQGVVAQLFDPTGRVDEGRAVGTLVLLDGEPESSITHEPDGTVDATNMLV